MRAAFGEGRSSCHRLAVLATCSEFQSRIAHAREAQQDAISEGIVEMADKAAAEDWQVVPGVLGTRVLGTIARASFKPNIYLMRL